MIEYKDLTYIYIPPVFKTQSSRWEDGMPNNAHSSKGWIDHGKLLDDGHIPDLSLTYAWETQSVRARTTNWNPSH